MLTVSPLTKCVRVPMPGGMRPQLSPAEADGGRAASRWLRGRSLAQGNALSECFPGRERSPFTAKILPGTAFFRDRYTECPIDFLARSWPRERTQSRMLAALSAWRAARLRCKLAAALACFAGVRSFVSMDTLTMSPRNPGCAVGDYGCRCRIGPD